MASALNAQPLLLGELSAENSRQLLAYILGEQRVQAEEAAVAQIGTRLHYLPLAVEIVAQRLKSRPRQPLVQMAERLQSEEHRLGLEISDRAVRTSFAISWQALAAPLQRIFALLAVFAGRPFTAAAIAHIADEKISVIEDRLYSLEALSLVKAEGATYYRQHPLLADFASEKLLDADAACARMADYYHTFVQANKTNYAILEPEWANIMAAIQTAHRQANWSLLLAFTDALTQTWLTRARYGEARQVYALAQEAASQLGDKVCQAANLLRWGEACIEQNAYDEAKALLSQSLTLYYQLEENAGIASAQYHLANIAIEQNDYEEAATRLTNSLEIRQQINDKSGFAAVLVEQARIQYDLDAFEQARALAEQALTLQQQVGDQHRLLPTLRMLAQIALLTEQYEQALNYCQEAQALSGDLQNQGELAATFYTLTCIYRVQQDFARSKLTADEGMALIERLGLRRYKGMLLYQLGHIYRGSGNLQQACQCTLQSIEIFRAVAAELDHAYSLLLLGDLYSDLGQASASHAAWQAAQISGQIFNHPWLLAQVAQRLG